MHRFDLEDLQFFRVGDDVFFGGLVADTGLEGDQTGLGQQLQTAAAVDRVVGDGDAGALGQLSEAFEFFRVQADVVDDPRGEGHQVETAGGLGVFQKRDVLEVVHVDVTGRQADVGRDPVAELDQLDVQALFLRFADGRFEGDGKGCGGADFQGVGGLGGAEQAKGQGQGCDRAGNKGLKHAVALPSGS
ncbi:hypothetical protein D3C79_640400 [compost metagenome]